MLDVRVIVLSIIVICHALFLPTYCVDFKSASSLLDMLDQIVLDNYSQYVLKKSNMVLFFFRSRRVRQHTQMDHPCGAVRRSPPKTSQDSSPSEFLEVPTPTTSIDNFNTIPSCHSDS